MCVLKIKLLYCIADIFLKTLFNFFVTLNSVSASENKVLENKIGASYQ